jgi:hypothetical protein
MEFVMARRRRRRKGPSLSGIFTQYFVDHPDWLSSDKNEIVVGQFSRDHPEIEVDKKVKQAMYNVKSRMNKGDVGRQRRKMSKLAARQVVATAGKNAKPMAPLNLLEEQIDDCMILAKQIGREQMHHVLNALRSARNAVVVMLMG